jgi:hypothetical protein
MLEAKGNIWYLDGDALCITTNGFVKKDGTCVMGRGIAKEAAGLRPELPAILGSLIQSKGNHVHVLDYDSHYRQWVLSFPVKHNWFEKADIKLIKRSAEELVVKADELEWERVLLPRPGCGNGKLNWEEVKAVLEPILDDRFVAVTF